MGSRKERRTLRANPPSCEEFNFSLRVTLELSLSTPALLTCGAGSLLQGRAVAVLSTVEYTVMFPYPLEASSISPTSWNNQKCWQTSPQVPWAGGVLQKSPLWLRITALENQGRYLPNKHKRDHPDIHWQLNCWVCVHATPSVQYF